MRQVGDYVTIKKPLPVGSGCYEEYGEYGVAPYMQLFAGMTAKITKVLCCSEESGGGCYRICLDKSLGGWTDKMFEK